MAEALFSLTRIGFKSIIDTTKERGGTAMSQAVQAALPWIVCGIAAAILITGIIDFLRKKKPESYYSTEAPA